MKAGRPADPKKEAYVERFGLRYGQAKHLRRMKLEQLEACKDDAARRILLGVSK